MLTNHLPFFVGLLYLMIPSSTESPMLKSWCASFHIFVHVHTIM